MRMMMKGLLVAALAVAASTPLIGQVHKSLHPRNGLDRHNDQDGARHGPDVHGVSGRPVQEVRRRAESRQDSRSRTRSFERWTTAARGTF